MTVEAGAQTISDLVARLELQLEQYKIHADSLARGSKDRDGADEIVKRLEQRIENLRSFGADLFTPKDLAARMAAERRPGPFARRRGTSDSG